MITNHDAARNDARSNPSREPTAKPRPARGAPPRERAATASPLPVVEAPKRAGAAPRRRRITGRVRGEAQSRHSMPHRALSAKARVFVVDDHPIVRRGLQLLISLEPDLVVCGEADARITALERIQKLQPHVVVLDLGLKNSSGLELLKDLRARLPDVKVLVFSVHDEPIYTERVLKAGAHGYVTKEDGAEKALDAIRCLLNGKTYLSGHLAERMLDSMTGFAQCRSRAAIDTLSDRELEILELIGKGMGSAAMAQRLNLSIKTIESHREHTKAKLGLRRATELVQYAFNWVHRGSRI